MRRNGFNLWMIIGSAILTVWLFFPFLKSFFVALLLVIAFSPLHDSVQRWIYKNRFLRHFRNYSDIINASIITTALFIILFVPIIFFTYYVASHPDEMVKMAQTFQIQGMKLLSHLPPSLSWVEEGARALMQKASENQAQIVSALAVSFGNGIMGFLGGLGEMVMIVIFFFFLSWYRRPLILAIVPLIPMRRVVRREFMVDMIATTAAGFYTLIGVAIAQGLAFGIFISFFKLYDPWLFGLMIAVTSVIPIVGTAIVWIPVAINELFNGNGANALIIVIYSWAMLSFFIDNFVRLIILQQLNKFLSNGRKPINDFLVFFAIVAGLTTFGFWGFILGPAIIAFVVTLMRMLRRNHVVR